jgi:hypothetical protein
MSQQTRFYVPDRTKHHTGSSDTTDPPWRQESLARIFHQGRARVGCDAVRWQGCSRAFGQPAVRLRNDPRLQARVRPARETTQRARAREAETGHKQSLRTVCACRGPKPLALAEQRRKQAAAPHNRMCSARYKLDLALEAKKVSIHAVLRVIEERPGEICGLDRTATSRVATAAAGPSHPARCLRTFDMGVGGREVPGR